MLNFELPKKGSTITVFYKNPEYPAVIIKATGIYDKMSEEYSIKWLHLFCPTTSATYRGSHGMAINFSDIVDIKSASLPKQVSELLGQLIENHTQYKEALKQISDLEAKMQELSDKGDELEDSLFEVVENSEDLLYWKDKVCSYFDHLNTMEINSDHRKAIKLIQLKNDKLLVELAFHNCVQVLSKEYEDRIRCGEKVTDQMVKVNTPQKQNFVSRCFSESHIENVETNYHEGDKGFVDFSQSLTVELNFDIRHYSEWFSQFIISYSSLKRVRRLFFCYAKI